MFGQTFDANDLLVIGILVVLEGVLSIDNALVLGLLARRLPRKLQGKALTYGLVGAFVFRLIAIATASYLLHWRVAKLLGGAYLVWVAVKHFFFETAIEHEKLDVDEKGQPVLVNPQTGKVLTEKELGAVAPATPAVTVPSTHSRAFWMTVGVIELTDIAFAIDSIVAAIGVVGPPPQGQRHPKLWVVLIGGMLGVILMRFAAVMFIRLLEKFPRFEMSAYLLVIVIGVKLIADYIFNTPAHPDRLDFHSPEELAFWVFWGLMTVCFSIGFIPHREKGVAA